MKDETYSFISDVKEKGTTARSAKSRCTHSRGGKVRFPSDNLSKKELMKMNGECKSYRLNEPMAWNEFRAMPDDIKITYIKLIRQKFNPSVTQISKMMGVTEATLRKELKKLNLNEGKTRSGRTKWNKEGFWAWVNGNQIPEPVTEEPIPEQPVQEDQVPVITSEEPEVYMEEDIPFEEPDPVMDEKILTGIHPSQAELLKAELEKANAENAWLRKECESQSVKVRILEAQMEVVRLIFGGKGE